VSQHSACKYAGFLSLVAALFPFGTTAAAQEPFVVLEYNSDRYDTGHGNRVAGGHLIARGETLYGILRHYFGANADFPHLAQETVRNNPNAFQGGDMGRMLAGQTLVLPDMQHNQTTPDDIYFF
jgi:hypothetical protein